MAANGSGLQWGTVRSLALAWVLTLPASIALAGGLYRVFGRAFQAAAGQARRRAAAPASARVPGSAGQYFSGTIICCGTG